AGRIFNKKRNGSLFEVETTISPSKDSSGNVTHLVVVQRDVSHEVELERQLRQAQKMEAIGTLAGGIAHDFNNILGAIIGYTEMVKMFDIEKDSPVHNRLQQILLAADRAKKLVEQILTFSRQTEAEQRPVLFSPIVKEALKFLRASLPSTINIHQEIKTENDMILADPTQIHQVLMNLCTNAAHAMSTTGGVLEVGLMNVDLDDRIIAERFVGLNPGPYISLSVKDTGHGMESEVMDRIFDPYFTTKEAGRGTGMGLSVVHGIVKSHNGAIIVNSEPGKGSHFEVFFPRLENEKVKAKAELSPSLPVGNECILFVDDEETIADIGQKILESLGYQTIVERDSIKALDVFRDQADQFDLVITDLTMPGMTGLELAQKLLSIRPDIPIILCTGFGEALRKEKALHMGLMGVVTKPFSASNLAEAVREVLDEPSKLKIL
ncbi:MAG: response regulator, partial [Thermodesulfobacteriota bacterium]|nr:response regulator [Thermodesulfobacteriota bacterium]